MATSVCTCPRTWAHQADCGKGAAPRDDAAVVALRDIINTLGPAPCKCEGNCEGQTYEVGEALRLARVGLGLERDYLLGAVGYKAPRPKGPRPEPSRLSPTPDGVTEDSPPFVTQAAISAQRALGWPDFDPEDYCHRCGGRNVDCWYAPSPLWNAVMRGGSIVGREDYNGIVCPQCFAELAVLNGVVKKPTWRLHVEGVVVPLETTDPDGRTWDDARSLWIEPVA